MVWWRNWNYLKLAVFAVFNKGIVKLCFLRMFYIACGTPVNSLQCSGVPQCTDWETNVLGWPESSFGFLVRCHRKAQTDFLASPIFTKFLLLTPLHRISQVLQSHSQSCSVSYQIKAPEGAAKWLHVFTLRAILTVHLWKAAKRVPGH